MRMHYLLLALLLDACVTSRPSQDAYFDTYGVCPLPAQVCDDVGTCCAFDDAQGCIALCVECIDTSAREMRACLFF